MQNRAKKSRNFVDFQNNLPVKVRGEGGASNLENIVSIFATGNFSAAVDTNGNVRTWGQNTWGQLGNGITSSEIRSTPARVHAGMQGSGFLSNIVSVYIRDTSCRAIDANGYVYAWGSNTFGGLGIGNTSDRNLPVHVKGFGSDGVLSNIIEIFTSGNFSLALDADGVVWAWGCNSYGQLGDGTTTDRSFPVKVLLPW